jgi:hypothetical protein
VAADGYTLILLPHPPLLRECIMAEKVRLSPPGNALPPPGVLAGAGFPTGKTLPGIF